MFSMTKKILTRNQSYWAPPSLFSAT